MNEIGKSKKITKKSKVGSIAKHLMLLDGSYPVDNTKTLFTVLEVIENLTVALCKHQKWKEQVKVSTFPKFGDLILKTMTLMRFLKTKTTPNF